MTFKPVNRHLLVLPIDPEENKTHSGVLLPEDYKEEAPLFKPVRFVAAASDCTLPFAQGTPGQTLIVQASMLEKVKFTGQTYFLIKENYVVGVTIAE